MEIRAGGGVFGLGNPGGSGGGGGGHSDPGNPGGRGGGQLTLPSVRGGVDVFWNNPLDILLHFNPKTDQNFRCSFYP